MTGDRGLAGAFNSQIMRAAIRAAVEHEREGRTDVLCRLRPPRRVLADVPRPRGHGPVHRAHRPPGATPTPARSPTTSIAAYVDGELDRVEVFYNGYVSPLTQEVKREVLLPLQQATVSEASEMQEDLESGRSEDTGHTALTEYEPDPGEILERLVPDYVEISIYRALLESTASEHGARMTAMRNASENATEIIDDLTLQLNRERQADITQEIMEVVAGAESLTAPPVKGERQWQSPKSREDRHRGEAPTSAGSRRSRAS